MFSFLFCQNDGYKLGSGTSSSQGINVVPDMNYKMKLPDSIMRLKWGGGGGKFSELFFTIKQIISQQPRQFGLNFYTNFRLSLERIKNCLAAKVPVSKLFHEPERTERSRVKFKNKNRECGVNF